MADPSDDANGESAVDDLSAARVAYSSTIDESLVQQQQRAYAVPGIDENEPAAPPRKRRQDDQENGSSSSKKPKTERKNTAVYVTSLPLDTTIDEVQSVFSKYGIIAEEIDSGKPRIKLYQDEDGKFKGDALVVYFRAESVDLAVQMLDDSNFRIGQDDPAGNMRVKEADFSYKKQQDAPVKSNEKVKRKIIKRTQKLNSKLADWDDDDPSALHETSSRWDKVVILKHMFTLQELDEDPMAHLDIEEDIKEECSKLGEVEKIVLFAGEEDGIVSVQFENTEAADACVRLMDGRMFGGQKVEANIADGEENFRRKRRQNADS